MENKCSLWPSPFFTKRKFRFPKLCFLAQSANNESGLFSSQAPRQAEWKSLAERSPRVGRGWRWRWRLPFGRGGGAEPSRSERRGTAPSAPRPHRLQPTRLHDLGRGFRQRRQAFRLSRFPAFLPGRDFPSIIDRRRAAELVEGAHRRSVWVARSYAPRKGTRQDALPRSLSYFFFPARSRLARTS